MCSRYFLTSAPDAVRKLFGHGPAEPFPPRYNIAPTQPVAIVRTSVGGQRELALVRWGLIPSWAKDPARFGNLFNARAETACERASFRGAMRHRRCLVPADGYYEWTGPSGHRRPFLLRPATAGPIALAGLWEHWLGADGSEIETMAILTVPANAVAARIHDRMPAILAAGSFDAWLDTRDMRAEQAARLLAPAPEDLLESLEIGNRVNSPRNEGPELHKPTENLI
jgi:putative SOS response-associated peptidase YedK